MKKINIIGTILILIFLASSVLATTQTFTSISVADDTAKVTNGNQTNTSTVDLGSSWTYTLERMSYIDSSTNANETADGCNESMTLWYGSDTTGMTALGLNPTNETTAVETSLGDVDGRYVKIGGNFSYYGDSVSNCTISSMTLTYRGSFEESLQGLPHVGTDVGSFLTNLAPGVGAFIIIMGVFGAVGMLLYALVSIVKRKVEEK